MKFIVTMTLFLLQNATAYSQNTLSTTMDPDSVLVRVNNKLKSLKNIKYDNIRELNYSSENYLNTSKYAVYFDFDTIDTIAGFKYQIDDSSSKQVFNGTEKFDLEKKAKTISINDQPDKKSFSSLSALYNSIITLKNILHLLIRDKTATKYVNDTTLNNTSYVVINVNIGKRRIRNLGLGFDAMSTKSDFIYKIFIDKMTNLPFEVLQINNLNSDFIRTNFTNIEINTTAPSEMSWYYSSYTNNYKLAEQTPNEQLLSNGSSAPEWKLEVNNRNKTLSLSELNGQVTLLDFWIKNCGPCIQSVPHLNELQNKFKDKKFKLISINSYDSKEDIDWFCNKFKANYPILLKGKAVAEKYGVSGFPTFFIIDKAGKIIYSSVGYSASTQSEVERIIANAL